RFDESFNEAWYRFKDLLRACPHHGFSELDQLDTFYNALNSKDQDSLNSAVGGNFLDKIPRECLAIIESKSKVRYLRNKPVVAKVSTNTSTSGISPDVAELKDMVKALLLDKKSQNQSPATVKAVKESYVTYGGAHSYRNCPATNGNVYRDNIQEFISQASAVNYNQGNTSYRPSMMSNLIRPLVVENKPEATKDTVHPTNNGSTEDVQPQVVQSKSPILTSKPINSPTIEPVISPVSVLRPNLRSSIPYLSRMQDQKLRDKANNQRDKPVVAKVSTNSSTFGVSHNVAELKDMVRALLLDKKGQNQSHAPVKAVKESCVTCGGAHSYRICPATDVQATPPPASVKSVEKICVTCGEQSYQAPTQKNQIVPLNELEKVKRINEANMKAMQTQINIVKNELRNEMKNSIQSSMSNQTNEIKNMMASLFHMNIASTSGLGSLPSNTVANPKGELKAITTQSGLVLDGPIVPTPPPFINPSEDECAEETLIDQDLSEYTIKVLPPPI
nr:reverse transcriptase domain-containing protein [Tanacetum cinerariifolium]